jgi:ferredoxin
VFELENGRARIGDIDACMECGACMKNCPFDAIRVNAGVGCASGMLKQWLREHVPGSSGRGCCS